MVSKRSGSMPAKESVVKLRRSARLGSNKKLMPRKEKFAEILDRNRNKYGVSRFYLNAALEKYGERHEDAELEVVHVYYFQKSGINLPGLKETQYWAHLCFTAKPYNFDNSDVSPKHFLAEFLRVDASWRVKYCNEFEPSADPGFKHDCVICGDDVNIHPPGPDGYKYGGPPCRVGGLPFLK